MTTEMTNISAASATKSLPTQLPVVAKTNESTSSAVNPDNIIRIDFEQRQDIANLSLTSNDQSKKIEQEEYSDKTINSSVQELNNSKQFVTRNLEFQIDVDSGKTVITVRDTETKELIRQIPSEQLLVISTRLKELQTSRLADKFATGTLFTSKT